jgi:hypothetical protein
MLAEDQLHLKAEEDVFLRTYGRSVFTITFLKHLCLLEKQIQETVENFVLRLWKSMRAARPFPSGSPPMSALSAMSR